jgi:hypothetical protein
VVWEFDFWKFSVGKANFGDGRNADRGDIRIRDRRKSNTCNRGNVDIRN